MGTKARQEGYIHKDGYLWEVMGGDCSDADLKRIDCPEEEDVFKALNMDYIEPELRQK